MRVIWIGVTVAALLTLILSTPSVQAAPTVHCGELTGDQTWSGDPGKNEHRICSTGATIRNGMVTIGGGAFIIMEEGANLVFGEGAGMRALGTATTGKIRVLGAEGDAPGYWGQIRFDPGSVQSEANGMDIQYGGKGGVPMMEIRGGPVVFDSQHQYVEDPPMEFHNALDVPLAFAANLVGPSLELPGILTRGDACFRVVVSGNGHNGIGVLAEGDDDVTDSQVWHSFCVPYLISDPVEVGSPSEPLLEIDYGTTIELDDDGGFLVGLDAERFGQLGFNGTPDKPILVTGGQKEPGAWGTIDFTPFSEGSEESEGNSIMNTVVEYGGRGGRPMVQVRSSNIVAYESQFNNAEAQPVAIAPPAVGAFMSGLTRSSAPAFNDNGINRIMVLARDTPIDVPTNAEWGNAGAPYQIDGPVLIADQENTPTLALTGNAQLLFDPEAMIVVGDPTLGNGNLVVQGYITDAVVLGASAAPTETWGGIRITDDAESVTIDRATIENGGSSDQPMVQWGRAPGRLVRSSLRGARGYPLSVVLSRLEVVMDEEQRPDYRSVFEDNGVNRILVHSDGIRGQAQLKWSDPGAPLEFDSDVIIGSPTRPLLVAFDGLTMVFRSGAHLQIGASEKDRAVMQVRNDVASRPVLFGAADETTGWGGVRILPDSSLSGEEVVFSGAADDAANISVEGGTLSISSALFRGSNRGTGVSVSGSGALADIALATFNNYRVGVNTADRGRLDLSRSTVSGNSEWGVRNEDPMMCQRANRVYWGTPDGPNDESDAPDGCMNAKWDSPNGDRVSDDVDWWPYALDATAYTPVGGLGPNAKHVFLPLGKLNN